MEVEAQRGGDLLSLEGEAAVLRSLTVAARM